MPATRLKHILLFVLLISSNTLFAQLVVLKGKVVDKKTNMPLPGVSVRVGTDGAGTDKNGNFTLNAQLKVLNEKGISFSSIGYLKAHLIYEPNHFYDVELGVDNTQLKEVVIGAGEDIIKKALKKIPQNYPQKPIILKGILRTQTWRNKSEYFKSDAIIQAYVPPYNDGEKTSVAVLENHIDTLYDKSLRYLRHINNYNVADFEDIVHSRFIFNKILKKRRFDYLLIGKQVYNHHKVFVINTSLKDTDKRIDKIDVTLYIDTASYAFVAANIDIYNWARLGILTIKKLNFTVTYQEIGKKWYLAETHSNYTSELKNQSPQTTTDFIRTEIDSVNVERIPYKDIIQERDDILLVDKPTSKERWAANDSLFRNAETAGKIVILPTTLLDTITKNNAVTNPPGQTIKRPFVNRMVSYLSHDNVRTVIGVTKFPVKINSSLYPISESVAYGLEVGTDYRLYKSLFLDIHIGSNVWNNKHIGVSTVVANLSNDFIFNKNSRSITVTPYAGFDYMAINYQKGKVGYSSFNCGLRIAQELSHKTALFLSSGYNAAQNTSALNGLIITPTHYTFGFGFVLKH